MGHTIVLMQPGNKTSRTFMDYENVSEAMDGICGVFERELKRLNPNLANITYDIQDLYNYIDRMPDMIALVLDPKTNTYRPHNKEWIKERCFDSLQRQVAGQ